jgi:capsid portal protein
MMRETEGEDTNEATEVYHFSIHSPRTPYGLPRWTGVLIAALGSHEAEEVNLLYFENKSVPPLALLVTGGRITEETVQRIKDHVKNEIQGVKNFHKILVLEAESGARGGMGPGLEHTGRMTIELRPLTDAMHRDALFQRYDERNILKIGQAFRLPALLRGDSRDFNRATAVSVLKFAETQVFAPMRDEFDDLINRHFLSALGARYWKFASNSPRTTDPLDQSKVLGELTRSGAILPIDARSTAEEILNRDLVHVDEPWTRIPFALSLAGRVDERDLFSGGPGKPGLQEGENGSEEPQPDDFDAAVLEATSELDREVVSVPDEEWQKWQKGFTPSKRNEDSNG